MKAKDSKINIGYYWLIYAEHYLSLAEIGVNELVLNNQKEVLIKEVSLSYDRRLGIIPVIFCIRHALELTKKYLLLISGKNFESDHKLTTQLDLLDDIFQIHKANVSFSLELERFKNLLKKYEDSIFEYGKAFKKHELKDLENQIFRYPQKRNGEIIQTVDLVKEFPLKFIHNFRFDIYTIYTVLIFFQKNEGWLEDITNAKRIKVIREAMLKDTLGKMYK